MSDEKQNVFTELKVNFGYLFYKWILISLVFFLFGVGVGIWGSGKWFDHKMSEIVQVKGFLHDKQVYDVKVRP